MAGAPKTPARRSTKPSRAARNLAPGSPTPPTSPSARGEVPPRVGGPPPFTTWTQLHLFVVVYVVEDGPEPGRPELEPEPEDPPGHQLPLPGFPEPKTPEAHLAAMREHLDAHRPQARKKRPA